MDRDAVTAILDSYGYNNIPKSACVICPFSSRKDIVALNANVLLACGHDTYSRGARLFARTMNGRQLSVDEWASCIENGQVRRS